MCKWWIYYIFVKIHKIYFIDYETYQLAIPKTEGTKPYQQLPFQYSLHIIKEKGAPIEHKEFLAEIDDTDYLRHFAESMIKDMPENGSVIIYNKSFEPARNIPEAVPFSFGGNQLLIVDVEPIATGASATPTKKRSIFKWDAVSTIPIIPVKTEVSIIPPLRAFFTPIFFMIKPEGIWKIA